MPAQVDVELFERAIANLVDNALKFCGRGCRVTLAAARAGTQAEVSISDTGHGITPELKERLFLPYFSTKERGTGLGLAIVSRIVEEHRGTIRVEENKPIGARFIVELPVQHA